MSANRTGIGPEWHPVGAATTEDIGRLHAALPFALPEAYISLLQSSNGGSGPLSIQPLWFDLFDVDFTLHLWSDSHYRTEYPDLFFFGSNGGMESLALDMRWPKPWPVVMVDCVAGIESAEVISPSINAFISEIGWSEANGA